MIGFLAGLVFGGALGWVVSMLHSIVIEEKEAKERFEKGYSILSEQKEFLTTSDIILLEKCSGHKYEDEYDMGRL